MRWRKNINMEMTWISLILVSLVIGVCDGARRTVQRRRDTVRTAELYVPSPSAESLQAIAEAMGAAGFEHYTEGKSLVKRLIPADSQPDLDLVEHQGVIGKAGVDFPAYPNIPTTGFNCKSAPTGYYADLETDCQVFHICDTSRKISFLCPNGTIFSQSHLICDWWFKVDCASAPALYESSAEYYSNEQKKSQKITHTLHKNQDLQQIGDLNVRAESRRASVNVPSTTERLQRHRQRLQTDTPFNIGTSRSFHGFHDFSPTQRTQGTTALEKRRRNLVQLITNNFVAPKTTPTFSETTKATPIDYSFKEMQVAAESASFANNNNRQFLQDYHTKNFRPYPVYTPNTPKPKAKQSPNLTTLYDIREKHIAQETQEATQRPTLVSYTKSYTTYDHQPYTRPGVSLLKGFIEREKNKTLKATTTTERIPEITGRSDKYENKANTVIIEPKNTFESATKIPQTTRGEVYITEKVSSDRHDVYSTINEITEAITEPSYKKRRERLMRKLNLGDDASIDFPVPITTEKSYETEPNKLEMVVPPSLSPKALHSLAIYYATAVDNLSTTSRPEEDDITTPSIDYEAMEEALPALFSQNTINKYSDLFNHGTEQSDFLEEMRAELNGTFGALSEDMSVQQSQNPIATSPQIRELAQVFTHALSAYLQDPVQFRKVLSDIRPTHPSFGELLFTTEESINTEPTTTVNEDEEEILGFSEDNKTTPIQTARDQKALNVDTSYTPFVESTTYKPETSSVAYYGSTVRNPFRCCGRISASYTTNTTPAIVSTTPTYSNTEAMNINALSSNNSETTSDYAIHKYGGFQNNALSHISVYGNEENFTASKPLNNYVEATNLPTAWGIDASASTLSSTTINNFESKKVATTVMPTTTPVYFTETEHIELDNEEELQRAHSQSFIAPQNTRKGKQLKIDDISKTYKKPSENLEVPTFPDTDTTVVKGTTPLPTTTNSEESEITTTSAAYGTIFTSPDSEKTTYQQWANTYDTWQSTIFDPITLNDGLSPTGQDNTQTVPEENTYVSSTATAPIEYSATTEQSSASTINLEVITDARDDRIGRLLKDSSTEPAQDLSTITDTVVEKAKEIMGGMNATTTEKLMNVMKKTKSKTVKRLILLLIQTCDDDHNNTAEASKKALLEALMAVSQKDMEDIAKEEITEAPTTAAESDFKTTIRRMDRQEIRPRQFERRAKSLSFEPSVINSLSNPTTEKTRDQEDLETVSTTVNPRITLSSRRGLKKYRTTPEARTTNIPFYDKPVAEARSSVQSSDLKTASDTRALELLRSLYTIASKWG